MLVMFLLCHFAFLSHINHTVSPLTASKGTTIYILHIHIHTHPSNVNTQAYTPFSCYDQVGGSQALCNKVEPVLLVALQIHFTCQIRTQHLAPPESQHIHKQKEGTLQQLTAECMTSRRSHFWQIYCCCYFSNSLNACGERDGGKGGERGPHKFHFFTGCHYYNHLLLYYVNAKPLAHQPKHTHI